MSAPTVDLVEASDTPAGAVAVLRRALRTTPVLLRGVRTTRR